jgi:DNA gyrase subunit A
VIVTRDGWVKRQRSYGDVESIRVRDGDAVSWILPSTTRKSVIFFSNFGKAYTLRAEALPATTGHGSPVQKLFDFSDREHIVGVVSVDERALPKPVPREDVEPELFGEGEPELEGPFVVGVTSDGQTLRIALENYAEPSTVAGRMFMKVAKGEKLLRVEAASGAENLCLATRDGNCLIFPVSQIPVMKNAAKGVIAIRLNNKDEVIGFVLSSAARQGLEVETTRGRSEIVRPTKFPIANRGNKGRLIIQRGAIKRVIYPVVEITDGMSD